MVQPKVLVIIQISLRKNKNCSQIKWLDETLNLIIHNIAQILWWQSEKSLKATSNKRNSFYLKTQHFYNHVNYFAKPSLWTTAYKLMNECIIDFYEKNLITNWMWNKHISMLSFFCLLSCPTTAHNKIKALCFIRYM